MGRAFAPPWRYWCPEFDATTQHSSCHCHVTANDASTAPINNANIINNPLPQLQNSPQTPCKCQPWLPGHPPLPQLTPQPLIPQDELPVATATSLPTTAVSPATITLQTTARAMASTQVVATTLETATHGISNPQWPSAAQQAESCNYEEMCSLEHVVYLMKPLCLPCQLQQWTTPSVKVVQTWLQKMHRECTGFPRLWTNRTQLQLVRSCTLPRCPHFRVRVQSSVGTQWVFQCEDVWQRASRS